VFRRATPAQSRNARHEAARPPRVERDRGASLPEAPEMIMNNRGQHSNRTLRASEMIS
jgi:hypothetical protein